MSVNTDNETFDSEYGSLKDAVKAWNASKKAAPDVEKESRELSDVENFAANEKKRKEAIASKLDSLSLVFSSFTFPHNEAAKNIVRADAVVVMDDLKRHFNGEVGPSLSGDALKTKLNNLSLDIEGYFPPGELSIEPARKAFDDLLTEVRKDTEIQAVIDQVKQTVQKTRELTQARRDESREPFQNRFENFRPAPLNLNELTRELEMEVWKKDPKVRAAGLIGAADEKTASPKKTPSQTPRTSFDGVAGLDPNVPYGDNIPTPLSRTDSSSSFDVENRLDFIGEGFSASSTPMSSRSPSPDPQSPGQSASPNGKDRVKEAEIVVPSIPVTSDDGSSSSPKPERSSVGLEGVRVAGTLPVTPVQAPQQSPRTMSSARATKPMLSLAPPPPLPAPPQGFDLAQRTPSEQVLNSVLGSEPAARNRNVDPTSKPQSPPDGRYDPEIKFDNFVTEPKPVVNTTPAVGQLNQQVAVVSKAAEPAAISLPQDPQLPAQPGPESPTQTLLPSEQTTSPTALETTAALPSSVKVRRSAQLNPVEANADSLFAQQQDAQSSGGSIARSSTPESTPVSSRPSSPEIKPLIAPALELPVAEKYVSAEPFVDPKEVAFGSSTSARSDGDPAEGLAFASGENGISEDARASLPDQNLIGNTDEVDFLLDQYLAKVGPAEPASSTGAVLEPEKSEADFKLEFESLSRKLIGDSTLKLNFYKDNQTFATMAHSAVAEKIVDYLFSNEDVKKYLELVYTRGYKLDPQLINPFLNFIPAAEQKEAIKLLNNNLATKLHELAKQNNWVRVKPPAKSETFEEVDGFEEVKVENDSAAFPAKRNGANRSRRVDTKGTRIPETTSVRLQGPNRGQEKKTSARKK